MGRCVPLTHIEFGADNVFFSLSTPWIPLHPFQEIRPTSAIYSPLHIWSLFFWLFFKFWISHEITNIFQFHPFLIFYNLSNSILILLITIFFLFLIRYKITIFFPISPFFLIWSLFFWLLFIFYGIIFYGSFFYNLILHGFFPVKFDPRSFYCYLFSFDKLFKLIFFHDFILQNSIGWELSFFIEPNLRISRVVSFRN